jgi:uncharacterized protein
MTRELRFRPRAVRSEGDGRYVSGYASVFNQITDIGPFLEQVKPGAFARAISDRQDVRALLNHDSNLVLGRISNGSLHLKEDTFGLWFRCDVGRTKFGDDLLEMIRRQDVRECSFGFSVAPGGEEWTTVTSDSGRRELRTLTDLDLFDVSAVTFPAYSGTVVGVDERASLARMFPTGAPQAAPLEVRSRISGDFQLSGEEQAFRLSARGQAERLLEPVQSCGSVTWAQRRLKEIEDSL